MNRKIANKSEQLGQTLIETVVAIFILIVGLITALGLAIYSFQSSDSSSKQIMGTALARQGIEVVKNMRDTNWLVDGHNNGGGPYDCSLTMSANQKCYTHWLGGLASNVPFNLAGGTYILVHCNACASNPWSLSAGGNPVLKYDSATGLYFDSSSSDPSSIFSRQVVITENFNAPFTVTDPELIVTSTVWWQGRNCPITIDPTTLNPSCKVILEDHLTNWRNF